ncbi:MAG: hypothetical protein EOM35_03875 [Negativicutes bacterium]|nr:hypothetical protein [Negativicutes bacterium]
MNLEQILQNVESQLDIATGNIKWDDDETLARINLANTAIRTWASSNSTRWNELYTIVETVPLEVGANEFEVADDFMLLDAVVIASSGRELEIRDLRNSHRPGDYVTLSGNSLVGHKLRYGKELKPGDNMVGEKLKLCYYRAAKELHNPADKPEMSDSSFIVDYVSAAVSSDDDQSKFSIFASNYTQKLKDMITKNNQLPQGQYESALDDSNMAIGV